MKRAIKIGGKLVKAYRLGSGNPQLEILEREGKILKREDGSWEIFSREAKEGAGQIVEDGDYVKIDVGGWPYPNRREFFEKHHRPAGEPDTWEQIPEPVYCWEADDPMCPEIEFLLEKKGLKLCPKDPDRYFRAFLYGAPLSAARDSVLVFYRIEYGSDGAVEDAEFNFVVRPEFDRTYRWLPEE